MLIVIGSTVNRTMHNKAASSFSSAPDEYRTPSASTRLVDILSELRNLLEEYSPSWYTEEHHRKVESVLHSRKKR